MSVASVVKTIDGVEKYLKTITGFRDKVFSVTSEEELQSKIKGLSLPAIGVIYDGMRAVPEQGGTGKMGKSAELVVTLLLVFRNDTLQGKSPNDVNLGTLDSMRDKMLETRSALGHLWRFQLETPVQTKTGLVVYVQRWATPAQLVG